MSLGVITKIENSIDKRASNIICVNIHSQDGRVLEFRFSEKTPKEIVQLLKNIEKYTFLKNQEQCFAFEYASSPISRKLESEQQGWNIYDIEREFLRQRIKLVHSSPTKTNNAAQRTVKGITHKILT